MNIGKKIKEVLDNQGRTAAWLADKIDINEITLRGKLNRNSISADDLLKVSIILDINLEELKVEYDSLWREERD
jgi:hypothetical protein